MQRTTELEGKRLVVTGTAGGIGAAALRALVAAGAVVAALDISDEIDEAEASKAAAAGSGKARYFHCDLRYRHEVDEVLAQAVAWLGGLDGLVWSISTASNGLPRRKLSAIRTGTWNSTSMCAAPFIPARPLPTPERTRRAHPNFGSAAGVMDLPGCAHYSAAKAAVLR